jgi:hypothetical protein
MTNMSEMEFIHTYCGNLTPVQKMVAENCINKKRFLGVGREIGGTEYLPMIKTSEKHEPMVILPNGTAYLASIHGRRLWEPEVQT